MAANSAAANVYDRHIPEIVENHPSQLCTLCPPKAIFVLLRQEAVPF